LALYVFAGVTIMLGVVLIPILLRLSIGFGDHPPADLVDVDLPEEAYHAKQRSWTRAEVLRDPRIYMLLPGLLAPPIILTAMFFHHLNLAEAKGWSYELITGSYVIYAAATVVTSLMIGPLIDRLGAVRLVPFMLVPLTLAMCVVAIFESPITVGLYMVLIGISIPLHIKEREDWVRGH
jgi:predicted MFS family arabinose efflux permease